MGCISSKLIIARSISFHEERNQRSMRKANGIPLLEDLIISTSDQYLTLVCTANKKSNKLHSKSLSSNTTKLAIEPEISEVIDEKLEPSTTLGEIQGGKQFENDHKNRSKSWHFPEHIVDSLNQENLSGFEDKDDLRSKSDLGKRSFHTVEEYDDIVNRIWLKKSQIDPQSEFNNEDGDGSVIKVDLQVSEITLNTTHHTQDKDSSIKEMQPLCLNKNEEVVPSHKAKMFEKGNKRKAIANRLESLRVPSNVESPAIASLRKWLPEDGIYSPGSYVTPKFGSYSSMNIRNENESSEDSIFSPELVSAFEQCMQKLEAEEENILKQILENVEEEIDEGIMQT